MATLIIVIHVLICILLIGLILIQSGRGGGLVDSFSNVESMFGTKANTFLTRTTTVLSIAFFITCLSLALLSARQSRSLIKDLKTQEQLPAQVIQPQPEAQEGVARQELPGEEKTQNPTEQEKTPPASKTE